MSFEGDKPKITPSDAQDILAKWKDDFAKEGTTTEHVERAQQIIAEATGVPAKDTKKPS